MSIPGKNLQSVIIIETSNQSIWDIAKFSRMRNDVTLNPRPTVLPFSKVTSASIRICIILLNPNGMHVAFCPFKVLRSRTRNSIRDHRIPGRIGANKDIRGIREGKNHIDCLVLSHNNRGRIDRSKHTRVITRSPRMVPKIGRPIKLDPSAPGPSPHVISTRG